MIENLQIGDNVNSKFLLAKIKERERKNGGVFFELHFRDKTGFIEGREWNSKSIDHVDEGDVVNVWGEIVGYNNSPQLKVDEMSKVEKNIDYSKFVREVDGSIDSYFENVLDQITNHIDNSVLSFCLLEIFNKYEKELKQWPAAQSNHHSKIGGLIKHIYSMIELADRTIDHYHEIYEGESFDRDLVKAGIILHDLWKIATIEDPLTRKKSDKDRMIGHIGLAIQKIPQLFSDYEKVDQLQHIVASHHGKKEWGSPVKPETPEAKLVHRLDMMDSRMDRVCNE